MFAFRFKSFKLESFCFKLELVAGEVEVGCLPGCGSVPRRLGREGLTDGDWLIVVILGQSHNM